MFVVFKVLREALLATATHLLANQQSLKQSEATNKDNEKLQFKVKLLQRLSQSFSYNEEMYACLKFKWARNCTSIPAADSKGEYVLSHSYLFTKLKFKTNQKQLLQQGIFFLSFGDLKKKSQENTTNTIS